MNDRWEEHKEAEVRQAFEGSERYCAFITEHRSVVSRIRWVVDPDLPEGIRARSTQLVNVTDGSAIEVIRLARIPPEVEDEYMVVHEVMHHLVNAEGFKGLGVFVRDHSPQERALESIASAITTMLHDPLVHDRLATVGYGEEVANEYDVEVTRERRILDNKTDPPDPFSRLHWGANYASKALDFRARHRPSDKDEFRRWFRRQFPEAAAVGERLLRIVDSYDVKRPNGVESALARIVHHFKLGHLMFVL